MTNDTQTGLTSKREHTYVPYVPHMWVWTLVYRSCYSHEEETIFSLSDSAALGYISFNSLMNSFQLLLLSLSHVSVSQWFLFPLCSIFSNKHLNTLYLGNLWLSSSLGIKVLLLSLKGLKPQTEIGELSAYFLWFVWFKAKEEDGLRKVVCWKPFLFFTPYLSSSSITSYWSSLNHSVFPQCLKIKIKISLAQAFSLISYIVS